MEYVQIDLNNVCRTCKNQSSKMKSLYHRDSESEEESPRLDKMLMACASVQVNNEDDLPKLICRSCFVQLKNAYSFKEQCEKTDLFLRDHLKNLKKVSIKEELITDLEFTSNFINEINSTLNDIGQINDDESIVNIKADPESYLRESPEKDVDYVQIINSNVTIYECRTCSKVFYTLEGLRCHKQIHTGNIEDHCVRTDFDGNTTTFSDQSDGGGGVDLVVDEETMKFEVEVSENNDHEMLEKAKIEEEMYRRADEVKAKEEEAEITNGYESDANTHPEYLPAKQIPTKIKRTRGKPRQIGNFPCPQCKEVFTKRTLLEKHAEQHDGLRIHECDSCNKKFSKWDNLRKHRLLHVDVKPFVCMTCGKCFTRKDHLQKHMKSHSSVKIHSCDLCQVVFSRLGNLAKHKALKHSTDGEVVDKRDKKKFVCSECGKFIRNDYLETHMRRHRGEKPFKCKFCGKGFPRTTDLTAHERYHTGEKTHLCVTCGRGFGRPYNLTVHMRTHTGEKPYRCTYCDAAFAQGYDLKAHIRRHTGERFQCELCPKTFIMPYLLTQHKRVVHGLNIVVNQGRLRPINKLNPDDLPPVTVSDPLQLQQIEVSDLKQEQESDIM